MPAATVPNKSGTAPPLGSVTISAQGTGHEFHHLSLSAGDPAFDHTTITGTLRSIHVASTGIGFTVTDANSDSVTYPPGTSVEAHTDSAFDSTLAYGTITAAATGNGTVYVNLTKRV